MGHHAMALLELLLELITLPYDRWRDRRLKKEALRLAKKDQSLSDDGREVGEEDIHLL